MRQQSTSRAAMWQQNTSRAATPKQSASRAAIRRQGTLPEAHFCIGQSLDTGFGQQHRVLVIAKIAVAGQRALEVEHHARDELHLLLWHEPWRIPAKPDAMAEARENALQWKAERL